jgi:hypothetical protein
MQMHLYSAFRARFVDVKERELVEDKPSVELTDEYLEFMQRQIDAEKPENFKLTPTSPSGW